MVGNVLLTSVYTCLIDRGAFLTPPPTHQFHDLGIKAPLSGFQDHPLPWQLPKAEVIVFNGIWDKPGISCPSQRN